MRRQRRHAPLIALAAALLLCTGCTRAYYHRQADREVQRIVTEKTMPGRWGLPGFFLQYDPRSRYFDPTNVDRPPMPPDDPVSHRLMHYIDGKHGALNYHRDGDLTDLPNPTWRDQLAFYTETQPDGTVLLTLDGAVQLARIHSPNYFQQLEELYLSALDVSTERWRFDAQFFGGILPLYQHRSREAPGGGPFDRLTTTGDFRVEKRLAAGGELVVGIANNIVWQFAGTDTNSNVSLLNFTFVQPLLRGGGRRFVMEQLTIVERTLVANLRAFERYRQGFYTNLAIGDGGTPGPQRRGGFFGGTGLTGFSGQGSGGFGEVGNATNFGRNNNAAGGGTGNVGSGFAGGGAGNVGGFLGILQQTQQIRNSRQNLDSQLRTLRLLEANLEAGVIDIAQVDQFRQNIETARATLLQSEINRVNSLETYKRQLLGLPPDLPLELDDSMIRRFEFIDPRMNELYGQIEDFVDRLGDLPDVPSVADLRRAAAQLALFRGEAAERMASALDDLQTMQSRRAERVRTMTEREASLYDVELKKTFAALDDVARRFAAGEAETAAIAAAVETGEPKPLLGRVVAALTGLGALVQEATLVQVRARLESVTLEPVKLDPVLALEIARSNRFDWMNNRAALVDTWRLIAFNARTLMSDVDVTFDGDVSSVGDNPVKFRSTTGRMSAGLEFDAPFTRLLQRNNYRSILISYQRDRRQLIQFEDSVNQTLRQSLRNLAQLEVNLEIQRRAVTIAARRVDQTRETLSKPPEPAVAGQTSAAQFGPTAALNLLTAMNDLQSSQNNFMSVWLNHYATRMVLMRELGLMELDERGIWIDVPLADALARAEMNPVEPLPPAVPKEWLDALEAESVPPPQSERGPTLPEGRDLRELTPPDDRRPDLLGPEPLPRLQPVPPRD